MWRKKRSKILILDEAKHNKKTIQKLFSKQGVISDYSDALMMLEKVETFKPNMILFNTELLKSSGMGSLKRLTSSCSIPVIALSGKGEDALEAMFAGAKYCMEKPEENSPESLEQFIRDIVTKLRSETGAKSGLFSMFD
ncbi:MAG: response regulator [Clostridia bacterium]|nr:response regulator [Clostridia bacterium]